MSVNNQIQSVMKTKTFYTILLFVFIGLNAIAQVPEKAEDISPLLIGESMVAADLVDVNGNTRQVLDVLKDKPTLILVYRGGWCFFCNQHMAEIYEVKDEILDLGYQILAISTDTPENLKDSIEVKNYGYQLFSDTNGDFSKSMGIAFQASGRAQEFLAEWSATDDLLPVPSVFVTNKEGLILFEYINPDFRTRISANLLVAALSHLNIE